MLLFFSFSENQEFCKVIEDSVMTENSNMNSQFTTQNSDEGVSDLVVSKNHILAAFAALEKKEKKEIDLQNEKQMLKIENQATKLELKESQENNKRLLQELESKNLALNELQADKENLQKIFQNLQNESDQKDNQLESLNMELIEVKQ